MYILISSEEERMKKGKFKNDYLTIEWWSGDGEFDVDIREIILCLIAQEVLK